MQKYDRYIKVLSVFIITAIILFVFYQSNKKVGVVYGYNHLIGLSLPNAAMGIHINLIQDVNEHENEDKDVNILVKEAQDNAGQQVKDIIDLENHGIDLLVISPINDTKVLEKLKELSIPIVVLNERAALELAEAYIEYDNWGAGELLANFILENDNIEDPVVLLAGNEMESTSVEREEGFLFNLPQNKRDKVEKIYCNWRRNEAENQTKAYLVSGKKLSKVVSVSDEMAYGAYRATQKLRVKNVSFYGINGFEGRNEGLDLLEKGYIQNTVKFEDMYRTMMKVSLAILKGESYEKETILKATLVKDGMKNE